MNRTVKLAFELPMEKSQELERLVRAGISCRKDLLNNALTLLEWATKEREKGRSIASVDEPNKFYKELVMPCLAKIVPLASSV